MAQQGTIGLVFRVNDDGVAFIYIPGVSPDPIIDQRESSGREQLAVGDFVACHLNCGVINDFAKCDPVFPVTVRSGELQAKTLISFYPETFPYDRDPDALGGYVAYSPTFGVIGCMVSYPRNAQPARNRIYIAWIQKLNEPKRMMRSKELVTWGIVDDSPLKIAEDQQILLEMPWNKAKLSQARRPNQVVDRSIQNVLKTYTDNYEGLVTAVEPDGDRAIVWSSAISVSQVFFLFGGRLGMKPGCWVRFNCEPAVRQYKFYLLEGKKFEVVDDVCPTYVVGGTVLVEFSLKIGDQVSVKRNRRSVHVETVEMGRIDFPIEIVNGLPIDKHVKIIIRQRCSNAPPDSFWCFHCFPEQLPFRAKRVPFEVASADISVTPFESSFGDDMLSQRHMSTATGVSSRGGLPSLENVSNRFGNPPAQAAESRTVDSNEELGGGFGITECMRKIEAEEAAGIHGNAVVSQPAAAPWQSAYVELTSPSKSHGLGFSRPSRDFSNALGRDERLSERVVPSNVAEDDPLIKPLFGNRRLPSFPTVSPPNTTALSSVAPPPHSASGANPGTADRGFAAVSADLRQPQALSAINRSSLAQNSRPLVNSMDFLSREHRPLMTVQQNEEERAKAIAERGRRGENIIRRLWENTSFRRQVMLNDFGLYEAMQMFLAECSDETELGGSFRR